jgi:hypothetical protein
VCLKTLWPYFFAKAKKSTPSARRGILALARRGI